MGNDSQGLAALPGWGIYYRLWPGFADDFPYSDVRREPDDDLDPILFAKLVRWLWDNLEHVVEQKKAEWTRRRVALVRQARTIRPSSGGARHPGRRVPRHKRDRWERFIELARFPGWRRGWGVRLDQAIVSRRMWIAAVLDEELAQCIALDLQQTGLNFSDDKHALAVATFNPRFEYCCFADLSLSDRLSANADIARLNQGHLDKREQFMAPWFLPRLSALLGVDGESDSAEVAMDRQSPATPAEVRTVASQNADKRRVRADGKTDGKRKSWPKTPENPDVMKLHNMIENNPDPQRSLNDIAREFTDGDMKRAHSLLRKRRDFLARLRHAQAAEA